MTKSNKPITLAAAFAAIAEQLTDMKTISDQSTGEQIEVNQMAYAQRRILNGITYSTELTLSSTRKSIDKAANDLLQATRQFRGDELSQAKVDKAASWIERLQLQETVLDAFFTEAKAAHLNFTGESYIDAETQSRMRDLQKRSVEGNASLAQANRILASLGIKGNTASGPSHDSSIHSSDPAERAA